MSEDKLTHVERLRLEAVAQSVAFAATQLCVGDPPSLDATLANASRIAAFLALGIDGALTDPGRAQADETSVHAPATVYDEAAAAYCRYSPDLAIEERTAKQPWLRSIVDVAFARGRAAATPDGAAHDNGAVLVGELDKILTSPRVYPEGWDWSMAYVHLVDQIKDAADKFRNDPIASSGILAAPQMEEL